MPKRFLKGTKAVLLGLLLILNLLPQSLAKDSPLGAFSYCDQTFHAILNQVLSKPEQNLIEELAHDPVVDITHPRVRDTNENPVILQLRSGKKIVFKNNEITQRSNGMKKELAAFLFDRMLKTNLVPTTLIREENSIRGSAQLFLEGYHRTESIYKTPEIRIFDFLIDTHDRVPENVLWTKSGRPYAIDHGFTFVPSKNPIPVSISSQENVISTAKKCPRMIRNLRNLSDEMITGILKPLVGAEPTEQVLIRKKWLLEQLD